MNDKDEVKALWKRCFDDGDEFIDLYFRLRYKDEINRVVRRGGRIVSALQAIPYPMTWGGTVISVAYISGACTHPDYRAQGLMRQLLADTHRRMYDDGALFGVLIPAEEGLKAYYARSGYVPVFGNGEEVVPVGGQPSFAECRITAAEMPDAALYAYFDARMRARSCCIQHTADDFRVVLADWQLGHGKLWVARKGETIVGMAFAISDGHTLRIKELLADTPAVRCALIDFAGKEAGVSVVSCPVYPPKSDALRGMARLIHAEKLLAIWAKNHSDVTCHFSLEGDDAVAENNGYYVVQNGTCRRTPEPPADGRSHTVASLTRALFEGECPYMSLMLD